MSENLPELLPRDLLPKGDAPDLAALPLDQAARLIRLALLVADQGKLAMDAGARVTAYVHDKERWRESHPTWISWWRDATGMSDATADRWVKKGRKLLGWVEDKPSLPPSDAPKPKPARQLAPPEQDRAESGGHSQPKPTSTIETKSESTDKVDEESVPDQAPGGEQSAGEAVRTPQEPAQTPEQALAEAFTDVKPERSEAAGRVREDAARASLPKVESVLRSWDIEAAAKVATQAEHDAILAPVKEFDRAWRALHLPAGQDDTPVPGAKRQSASRAPVTPRGSGTANSRGTSSPALPAKEVPKRKLSDRCPPSAKVPRGHEKFFCRLHEQVFEASHFE